MHHKHHCHWRRISPSPIEQVTYNTVSLQITIIRRSRSVSIPRSRPRSPDRRPPPMVSPRHNLSSSAAHGARTLSTTSSRHMGASSRDQPHSHHHSHHLAGRSATAATSSSASAAAAAVAIGKTRHIPLENLDEEEDWKRHGRRTKKSHVPEDPRLARQQHAAAAAAAATSSSSSAAAVVAHNASNGESSAHTSKKRTKAPEKVSDFVSRTV